MKEKERKQVELEEVKGNSSMKDIIEIWKETEIRMFQKIDAWIEQMEKVERKKNLVIYNLPESEEEQQKTDVKKMK